jgi:hypothetical protein
MIAIAIGLVIVGFIVLGGGHTFNGIGNDIGKLTKRDQREKVYEVQPDSAPVQVESEGLRPMEPRGE